MLKELGIPSETAEYMKNLFGPSGICNILGAIKMAKYLRLGPDDNVVTIATDSFDRYESVIQNLNARYLEVEDFVIKRWVKDIFLGQKDDLVFDFRRKEEKEKLFLQKEKDWLKFGYSKEYLDSMKNPEFWEKEYLKIEDYNRKISEMR